MVTLPSLSGARSQSYAADVTHLVRLAAPSPPPGMSLRTAVPALALAMTASGLLLWGRSYPGFPMLAAALAILAALVALVLALIVRHRGRRRAAMLATVILVLGAGIATSGLAGNTLLRARWSGSASAFDAHVRNLGPPASVPAGEDGASFRELPSRCPTTLGWIRINECLAVDRGYLFLQAPNAVTDSSGIAYLPEGNNPETTGLNAGQLTPLGGPWWSWTCYC